MNLQADMAAAEAEAVPSLLDDLFAKSRLYRKSKDYGELLDFVVRLRNFAPFNAMLLQVQKPGLSYAASERDWCELFGRELKEGARPLLILWPFGPVALVYDVMDTDGDELPEDVASFVARGQIDEQKMESFPLFLARKNIDWHWIDAGDRKAGSVSVVYRALHGKETSRYRLEINKNHTPAVQFTTLAHELGHLYLGHLGADSRLKIPERPRPNLALCEVEAESVAYIVCKRNGVEPKSQTYLSDFLNRRATFEGIAVYQIMRAAGRIEALLELATATKFDGPSRNENQAKKRFVRRQNLISWLLTLALVAVAVAATIAVYESRNT